MISGLLAMILARNWRFFQTEGFLNRLWPLGLFAFWAMISTLWSPLKVKTIWHAEGTLALVMLSGCVALALKEDRSLSSLLMHLSVTMCLLSGVGLAWQYLVQFTPTSELSRQGSFAHLNTLGNLAGAGLLILVACWLLWKWRWTKLMILPGSIVHGLLFIVTASRMAIIATILGIGAVLLLKSRRILFVSLLAMYAAFSTTYLVSSLLDLSLFNQTHETVVQYFRRGQTTHEILALSNRTIIWEQSIRSFAKSPIIGHGYFMITSTGKMDTFGGAEHFSSPHNFFLALLNGTGVIGAFLLIWGLWRVLLPAFLTLISQYKKRKRESVLIVVVTFWFGLVGLLDRGLLDAIRPQVVLFFVLAGLAITMPNASSKCLK